LKNRSVNIFVIEKNETNVKIKDAPCEVSDQFIATHMSKYGQVINGSIKRGVIKGTNIENGTRYVQILNCAPILPVRTNFGQFEIRLYADNNRFLMSRAVTLYMATLTTMLAQNIIFTVLGYVSLFIAVITSVY
jgi:RNA recognition motif-containing protein